MKYIFLSLVLFSLFGLRAQNAGKYLNKVTEVAKSVRSATWTYTNSVAKNKSAAKVEKDRVELVSTIVKAELNIREMEDFNGSSYYKDSVLAFLKTYKQVVEGEYVRMMLVENDPDLKDKYILAKEEATSKLLNASETLDAVERKFAAENGVKLVQPKSKVAESLRRTHKVYSYYNGVFMLFFRPYVEEKGFLNALEKGDIPQMEAHLSALNTAVLENSSRLNLKLDFEGDMSVVNTCGKVMDFYREEAQTEFRKIIDFQKFKAAYQKTKADLEAKPSSERSKGEVAEFNKLVKEYNERIVPYNDLILNMNAKREVLIEQWNNAGFAFEEKHLN